jgi:hypothetical protein
MPKKKGKTARSVHYLHGKKFQNLWKHSLERRAWGVATVRKGSCVGAAATNERNGGWGRGEDLLTIVALILTIQTHKGK